MSFWYLLSSYSINICQQLMNKVWCASIAKDRCSKCKSNRLMRSLCLFCWIVVQILLLRSTKNLPAFRIPSPYISVAIVVFSFTLYTSSYLRKRTNMFSCHDKLPTSLGSERYAPSLFLSNHLLHLPIWTLMHFWPNEIELLRHFFVSLWYEIIPSTI